MTDQTDRRDDKIIIRGFLGGP